jgi:hypothetical protein
MLERNHCCDNSGAETEHGIVVPAFRFRLQAEAGKVVHIIEA